MYGYTYNENGNVTTETVTTKDANGNVVTTEAIIYTYDDKEQLISVETSTIKYEYTYDDRDNILVEKEYAVTVDENGEKVWGMRLEEGGYPVVDDNMLETMVELGSTKGGLCRPRSYEQLFRQLQWNQADLRTFLRS